MGSKLATYINKHISGNVYNDSAVLQAYETDRSILRIRPKLVALPNNTEDVRKILNFANQLTERGFPLPVAVRGSGLDKTGADLTSGLVLSTERMTGIIAIDTRSRMVHVQAGVTLGCLNTALRMRGLTLPVGADPRETIGGLIANAPTDDLAAKYGGIMHFVERLEAVLPSGEAIQMAPMTAAALRRLAKTNRRQAQLYRNITNELQNYTSELHEMAESPDSAGYAGAPYVERADTTDLAALMYGSQGTLAVITEVILKVELLPVHTRRVALRFVNLKSAQKFLDEMMTLGPERVMLIDSRIAARAAELGKDLGPFGSKDEGFIAVAEFAGSQRQLARIEKTLRESSHLAKSNKLIIEQHDDRSYFDNLLSIERAYLNDGEDRAPLLDGIYLPNKNLPEFLKGLKELEESSGVELALFGSYATENYNVRPVLSLSDKDGRKQTVMLLSDYANLVKSSGGSLTGGTPEGRVKAMVTNHRLSDRQKELFAALKQIFDPNSILNPDIKTFASTRATISHLRDDRLIGEIS